MSRQRAIALRQATEAGWSGAVDADTSLRKIEAIRAGNNAGRLTRELALGGIKISAPSRIALWFLLSIRRNQFVTLSLDF
jgi:hypothetical protein